MLEEVRRLRRDWRRRREARGEGEEVVGAGWVAAAVGGGLEEDDATALELVLEGPATEG